MSTRFRGLEGEPVPTTGSPLVEVGQIKFLTVSDVTRVGAFVDWGLPKQLLVPFAEQTRDLAVGDREPFGVGIDNTGRFIGTMRIRELFRRARDFDADEWVDGEAWRNEPGVGVFVIIERSQLALLPEHEPHTLRRGQAASFRVTHVHPDGKIELSLRGLAHEELEDDAERVYARLVSMGDTAVSEKAHPDQVRALFGLSRKAFKRAVGRLLRTGKITLDEERYLRPVHPDASSTHE
jgi:predicted RNA-binding protein (virulence factor B family)